MRRREFIALLGSAAAVASLPLPAFAQAPSQLPLIAAQVGGSKRVIDRYFSGFSQGMRERGYVEGHDYRFEIRSELGAKSCSRETRSYSNRYVYSRSSALHFALYRLARISLS